MSQGLPLENDLESIASIPMPSDEVPSTESPLQQNETSSNKSTTEISEGTADSQTSDAGTGTPESTKDVPNKNSPLTNPVRTTKPVLGKIQAKKRLMAFANKYNVLPKVQKPKPKPPPSNRAQTSESTKYKQKSTSNVKMLIDELNNAKSKIEAALDIQEKQEQHSNQLFKSKKPGGIYRCNYLSIDIQALMECNQIFSLILAEKQIFL